MIFSQTQVQIVIHSDYMTAFLNSRVYHPNLVMQIRQVLLASRKDKGEVVMLNFS